MSAVADVLDGAADLIERDGWVQKRLRVAGQRCMAAALMDAAGCLEESPANYAAALLQVEVLVGQSVTSFNDHRRRTKAEVVAALRAAAERARA